MRSESYLPLSFDVEKESQLRYVATMIKFDFADQVALVTGASRGIGAVIAQELSKAGAFVIVTSTSTISPEELKERYGGKARALTVDFSSPDSTTVFVDEIARLPRLDVCINNAGIARHAPLEKASKEDWEVTHRVNLEGPFLVTKAASSVMRKRGYGRIVNIGSIIGFIGREGRAAYSAAKAGLSGLTRTTAVELGPHGILVNEVAPGLTATDMLRRSYSPEHLKELTSQTPLRRAAEPEEIARAVLFLASNINTYITGQSLLVDGGASGV